MKLCFKMIGIIFLLQACAGWIYDEEEENEGWTNHIDCRSYADWMYIRFSTQDTLRRGYEEEPPADWDFAIHRYDCKTNGGAVLETSYTSIEAFVAAGSMPEGEFVEDTDGRISVDMSGMMDGKVVYADSPLNTELCKWLNVNTNEMPPIYTPSKRVYLLRLSDGNLVALLFTDFSDASGVKGYISFDYRIL